MNPQFSLYKDSVSDSDMNKDLLARMMLNVNQVKVSLTTFEEEGGIQLPYQEEIMASVLTQFELLRKEVF